MADQPSRVPIPGSERTAPAQAAIGPCDPTEVATVTVYIRGSSDEAAAGQVSRDEYAAAYGAAPDDVAAVRQFAEAHGLSAGTVDLARRSVEVTGRLDSLTTAFGTTLLLYRDPNGAEYRGREGPLSVPAELSGVVTGVFGLDGRPQGRSLFRPRADARSAYMPPQVATAYTFPTELTGSGECIALIELGGGFRQTDLSAYFAQLGVTEPTVVAVPIDGGSNTPGTADGPDGEVMLDIEVDVYKRQRKKEAIRRRGENISAFEVEEGILRHPDVIECAVIGVPSELTEEDVKACVVIRPGSDLSEQEILAHCQRVLGRFQAVSYTHLDVYKRQAHIRGRCMLRWPIAEWGRSDDRARIGS